ncbi:hypothetical protein Tco_1162644 [Tanacetum coccineum]
MFRASRVQIAENNLDNLSLTREEYDGTSVALDPQESLGEVVSLMGTTLVEVILVKGHKLPTKVKCLPVGCDLLALVELFNPIEGKAKSKALSKVRFLVSDFQPRFIMDDPNITMEEYIRLEEEKAQRHGRTFNWQTATYGKVKYCEDEDDSFKNFESEFLAIVFDDTLTSDEALSWEPTVSPLNNNEIDFRISFDESDDEDYMVIFDENSFSYKIISIDNLKIDSENGNDKVNMPSSPSPEPTISYLDNLDFFKDFENEFPAITYSDDLTSKLDPLTEPFISSQHIDDFNLKNETSLSEYDEEEQNILYFNDSFPLNVIFPNDLKMDKENDDNEIDIIQLSRSNIINIDTKGSDKLLETSHNRIRKIFNNLYVPFGIPFDQGLILERQKTKEEMERMIDKAILQERRNIQAEISSQIQNAIDNHIPSQVDASVPQTICRPSAVRPRDRDDPHDDAYLEGDNHAKRQKTSEYEAYMSGESSSGHVNENEQDDDEIPMKASVYKDIMEEVH